MDAAILFEPDGYLLTGPRLMGRQSAGAGFLRAAVRARGEHPVTACVATQESADAFRRAVAELDPAAQTQVIPAQRQDLLAAHDALYRPDQILGPAARQRLRVGPAAYSLCGVTHTLATSSTLDAIAKILVEPVMPWDALVCTSRAALGVVGAVLDRQSDYLRWKLGQPAVERPLLPVIPLGVHCEDFAFSEGDRAAARLALGVAPDEVALLMAGRLAIGGKAHPYPLFRALQATAEATGKPLVLVFAGQAFNSEIAELFRASAADFCPDVRTLFVEGGDPGAYRSAWAAADIFVSLADSIQETFGLTPLEAMAAGLPALVSDWDGYKDTVRDGVDGFRVETWTPPPGAGGSIGLDFETGADGYEAYLLRCSTAVAVDMRQLRERLADLVTDEALRRRLGEAGRARARSTFDWSVIYRSYQLVWAEQARLRAAASADAAAKDWLARAPRRGADHLGPFDTFAGYPSRLVEPSTLVRRVSDIGPQAYRELMGHQLLALRSVSPEISDRTLAALADGPLSVGELAQRAGLSGPAAAEVVARLAKIDLVALSSGPDASAG
ncbi:MAG TPA: glycosyltransferase [Phenylobacterium sp.]|jgi:glycosyltransferase involved in cell wall biosynthesis